MGNCQGEAFTGERPGCVLSSEISFLRGRPCCVKGKAIVTLSANGEFNVAYTESRTTCMARNNPRGSWEIPETSNFSELDRSEKARCHNADVHVSGKSDSLVVPKKWTNNAGKPTAAESMEERGLTEENVKRLLMVRTQSRVAMSHGLFGVREVVLHPAVMLNRHHLW